MEIITIGLEVAILGIGVAGGMFLQRRLATSSAENATEQARKMVADALAEAERLRQDAMLKAKEDVYKAKKEADEEIKNRSAELKGEEKRFSQKLEQIERKIDLLDKREVDLLQKEKSFTQQEGDLAKRQKEIEALINEQRTKLENIAGITREEAQKRLVESIESEARMQAAKEVVRIENEMKLTADRKAKNILALAISRYAGEYVAEKTVSIVPLPNEEMKGRIIGREGRNIRAIEAATGIDIIIDDTPEAVILSGFNPVRREVARQAMERLIADGRIHPARIEEIVEKVGKEMENNLREAGEQATFDVGVHGMNHELIMLLGRLKYRTSYGQSVLLHSLEVAFLCGVMAAELGLDVKQAKRAGLLHDIGKAVDHEVEGSHAIIGRDLARKYGESPEVVHAIGAHHEDLEPESVLDILVQSADSLSGARPGARREMLESYVKRLEDLERLANGFKGVEKSFAIQAGREVRVIVDSSQVKDVETSMLGKDIAKKIEETMTYPGQIRVTVIRETRSVEYAK
ncbi:MAG: ribonuclease Y [Desulfobacteraceae bacterium]|nr:ribonuclease Y [Desulfobacteraceae bacterium]